MDQAIEEFPASTSKILPYELSKTDQAIVNRLKGLKNKGQAQILSEEELRAKFSHLKGEDPVMAELTNKSFLCPEEKLTNEEQTDKMLAECLEKVYLPQPDYVAEIQARLDRLRGIASNHVRTIQVQTLYISSINA